MYYRHTQSSSHHGDQFNNKPIGTLKTFLGIICVYLFK